MCDYYRLNYASEILKSNLKFNIFKFYYNELLVLYMTYCTS